MLLGSSNPDNYKSNWPLLHLILLYLSNIYWYPSSITNHLYRCPKIWRHHTMPNSFTITCLWINESVEGWTILFPNSECLFNAPSHLSNFYELDFTCWRNLWSFLWICNLKLSQLKLAHRFRASCVKIQSWSDQFLVCIRVTKYKCTVRSSTLRGLCALSDLSIQESIKINFSSPLCLKPNFWSN